ncbi:Stemmadenine O-acetyltransferase [Linum grandiflorum]
MEVPVVISVDIVKPTAKQLLLDADDEVVRKPPPFKLCLNDQLAPRNYFGPVLFYGAAGCSTNHLKASLSKALNSFYALSGRVKHNLTVEDFHSGVPFTETRVETRLSDFLKNPSLLELVNQLFPLEPACLITSRSTTTTTPPPPLFLVQVNVFGCGGVAVGLSFHHKVADGATADMFLEHWTSLCCTSTTTTINGDDFVAMSQQGSSVFPPRESIPSAVLSMADDWFQENRNTSTKRFVFDADAVAALKSSSKSAQVDNPTRNEVVSAFIWKSVVTAATSSATSSPPPHLLVQVVNIRRRMKHHRSLSDNGFGNLTSTAATSYPGGLMTNITTSDLVQLLRADVVRVDETSILAISTEEGFEAMVEGLRQFQELGGQVLTCSSWIRFFSDADFGWGKPVWTSVLGEASGNYPTCSNLVILTDNNLNGGIEACIRLDVDVMAVLQQDSEFLEFASLNPPITF